MSAIETFRHAGHVAGGAGKTPAAPKAKTAPSKAGGKGTPAAPRAKELADPRVSKLKAIFVSRGNSVFHKATILCSLVPGKVMTLTIAHIINYIDYSGTDFDLLFQVACMHACNEVAAGRAHNFNKKSATPYIKVSINKETRTISFVMRPEDNVGLTPELTIRAKARAGEILFGGPTKLFWEEFRSSCSAETLAELRTLTAVASAGFDAGRQLGQQEGYAAGLQHGGMAGRAIGQEEGYQYGYIAGAAAAATTVLAAGMLPQSEEVPAVGGAGVPVACMHGDSCKFYAAGTCRFGH